MDIAAELQNKKDLQIYIEGDWRKILRYFGKEKVDVELVHFWKDNDVISYKCDGEVSTYDEALDFCTGFNFTVAEFNRRCKKAELSALLGIHLRNDFFEIKGNFNDTFSITFWNYAKNPGLKNWLKKAMTTRQTEKLLDQLKKKKTYFSKGFAEFQTIFQVESHEECDLPNLVLNRIRVRSEREENLKKLLSKTLFDKVVKKGKGK